MFGSVLVANRAEIACRVIRTLRRLGVRSVAVHSDADAGAKHVREADSSIRIGEAPPRASYLRIDSLIAAARAAGADAVHPGYGFLAENASFARAVSEAGLAWVGPPPEVLELAGDKVAARAAFERSGFPVLPAAGPFASADDAVAGAHEVGFPVMVKAVAGGGGIGMGVAGDEAALRAAVETAATAGERFFSDPSVFVERYVPAARHVEIQVLFDAEGPADPPARARVLRAAAPPEGDRGDAVPGPGRRAPAADGGGVPPRDGLDRVRGRRDGRVSGLWC